MEIKSKHEKFSILVELLNQESLLIHLNPQFPEVILPEKYSQGPTLTLKISYQFKGSLEVSEEIITTELLFDGDYFVCQIPLDAIWGCTSFDNKNYIWPENIDPQAFQEMQEKHDRISKDSEEKKEKLKKPDLKRIK